VREKKKTPPPENFVDISQINKAEYALTPEQIEFFYPASKQNINWSYQSDSMTSAAKADLAYLKRRFPKILPDVEYFEEREREALFDRRFALRFPAIYYISKLMVVVVVVVLFLLLLLSTTKNF
jgi:hypothetical protein